MLLLAACLLLLGHQSSRVPQLGLHHQPLWFSGFQILAGLEPPAFLGSVCRWQINGILSFYNHLS